MKTNTQDLPAMERIKGFPDYSITKCGRVFSHKRNVIRELKQFLTGPKGKKYLSVGISENQKKETFRIHKLMAIQFLNHKRCGMLLVVDHIDNDKFNNHISNLQITTNRYNCNKDRPIGEFPRGVSRNGNGYQATIWYKGKREQLGTHDTMFKAGRAYQKRLAEIEKEEG